MICLCSTDLDKFIHNLWVVSQIMVLLPSVLEKATYCGPLSMVMLSTSHDTTALMHVKLLYLILISFFPIFTSTMLGKANCVTGEGYLKCLHHDGTDHTVLPLFLENGLWYHHLSDIIVSSSDLSY